MLFRYAPSYRENIYLKIEKELKAEFVFIKDRKSYLKLMDYSKLNNCRLIGREKNFKGLHWMSSYNKIGIKNYDNIIIAGDSKDLTVWRILISNIIYRKRIFIWTHGWYGRENGIKKLIKKIMFSLSDVVLLYGDYAKDLMIKNGINPSKLKVIYNSLDYEKQLYIRQNLSDDLNIIQDKFKNENYNIIFIGRLTKEKKLLMILKAIILLEQKNIFCNCTFIGKGDEIENLNNFIDENNLNNRVWFYGETFSEEEISKLIYNADLCVSPGNVGLTAMHSMVYGTPVITHNNLKNQMPEFEAIVPKITGDFFEEDNIDSLANCILNWLTKNKDRNIIRQNCYKVIDDKYNPIFQINLLKNIIYEK